MSVINSQPLIGASGNQGGAYNIERSLRLRSSATANLTRTFSSAGNRKTWTYSAWVKLGSLSNNSMSIFAANASASAINFDNYNGSYSLIVDGVYNGTRTLRYTTALYRDPAAWYHVVVALDTTQATDTNRIKLYVNGVQAALDNVGTGSYPAQNSDGSINNNIQHCVGQRIFTTDYNFDGYISEAHFIDGQALTPSSFGETDSITGVWKPKRYTGTYGTNGFYLPFTDVATTSGSNAGLGKDFSGNGNYWNTNNISVTAGATYDSMTDVPTLTSTTTANYAVINPLIGVGATSNGNITVTGNSGVDNFKHSSIGVSTGKWYSEFAVDTTSGSVGIAVYNSSAVGTNNGSQSRGYFYTGQKYANGSLSSYGSSFSTGDIIGIAVDLDSSKVWFSKNGTWQASGDPVAGTNAAFTDITSNTWFISVQGGGAFVANANFGQRPFAYTPPTGYKALNTYNLPDSTIVKGNTVMDATTYTGNGSSQTITNSGGFKPDLVWVKDRTNAYNHILANTVSGITKFLQSNTTDAESVSTGRVDAVTSTGFTVGSAANTNQSSDAYVGWQWQAGQGSTSSNTSGSITSTVSVNATAGFSIVTYTGTGATGGTIGHGLGVAPSLIIAKNRTDTYGWPVYHKSLGSSAYLSLNTTDASGSISNYWGTPNSTTFGVWNNAGSANNATGAPYVAYCWSEIAGFSKFGSYTGNGSADGPFVYTGFRPKFVLIKRTDSTSNWYLLDSSRSPYNVTNALLRPNLADAEVTATNMDFLSNGIKLRDAGFGSGETYIYAAFAENPFKYSLAR